MRDGVVTRAEGEALVEETVLTLPGNYPAYYAAIRDALNGSGENPVPASRQSRLWSSLSWGSNLPNIAQRSVWHKCQTLS